MSGGIGWGIAAAVGVQIAEPRRRVVAVIGDGSAMYSIQALWSAANQKLPMTFLICNNGGYQILKNRLKAVPRQRHADRHGLQGSADRRDRRWPGASASPPSASTPRRASTPRSRASLAKTDGPSVIEVMVKS